MTLGHIPGLKQPPAQPEEGAEWHQKSGPGHPDPRISREMCLLITDDADNTLTWRPGGGCRGG